jgi:MFS family permease
MAGQAIGKVILGIINDRSAKAGVLFGLSCGVAGVLLMWFMPSALPVLLAGAFLFGIVYAMTVVQTPLLVRTVFGSKDYTNIYSRVSMVGSLMSAVAAVFWSFVIDSPGGFPLMFVLGIVCMAICLVTALFALGQKDKLRESAR